MSYFKKCSQGFTLVELLVALFIMSIATALLLANYPDSTVRIELLNSTHSFSLLVREAQIRGSAIDTIGSTLGGYGVFVDSATSSQAILFGDSIGDGSHKNNSGLEIGDGLYNYVVTDKIKSTLKMKNGLTFRRLCVASSTATNPSPNTQGYLCNKINGVDIKTLTISFIRPSQMTHIYVNGSSTEDFSGACVQIYSLKTPAAGHVRSIRVYHAGIITTTTTTCD